ncbi:MAG: hypothetical protein ACI4D2_05460 [Lachnospiraceae bacterium]
MQEIKQTIAMCLLMAAFWGMMYPQFSLLEETYVCAEKEQNPREDFLAILEDDGSRIVIKSKLWELWKERAEKENQSKK